MSSKDQLGDWETVQARWADVPGLKGIEERRRHYAPFFLRFGEGIVIEQGCRFYHPDRICLDDDARINVDALIYGSGGVWIGRHARIGPRFFLHSANHDVNREDATAFFERGYTYAETVIGDNTLISANVSVMPGARIGNGTFAAAGCLIPAKTFPERAELYGVPAQDRAEDSGPRPVAGSPEIVIVTPRDGYSKDAARHLLSALGLPQIGIATHGETIPVSAHTALLFGPEDWKPSIENVEVWTLETGDAKPLSDPTFACLDGETIALPRGHTLSSVPSGGETSEAKVEQILFWLRERLKKGATALPHDEAEDWGTTLRTLDRLGLLSEGALKDIPDLIANRGRRSNTEVGKQRISEKLASYSPAARLQRIKDRLKAASGGSLRKARELVASRLLDRVGLGHVQGDSRNSDRQAARSSAPNLLVEQALTADATTRSAVAEQIDKLGKGTKSTRNIIACAIAATLTDDRENLEKFRTLLNSPEWSNPDAAMPRSALRGRGLCYSALTLIWACLEARAASPGFMLAADAGQVSRTHFDLSWRPVVDNQLVDGDRRVISRAFLDHWLTLHSAVLPKGRQFYLEDVHYAAGIPLLERAWTSIFRSIQKSRNRPLVRVCPWPAGKRMALSLRYDIDRAVSAGIVRRIVGQQQRHFKAPCGSWYAFPNDLHKEKSERWLSSTWQEVGVHALRPEHDEVRSCGTTHHSAPTSDYWQGTRSNRALDNGGAIYGEFLAGQTLSPRPAWLIEDGGIPYMGEIWTTPIHFPLEGSTSDTTLDYFDLRWTAFEQAVAQGGHVIIATHPDLNQKLLDLIVARGVLVDAWSAPVADVVQRCQALRAYGAVLSLTEGDHIALVSARSIADVQVEVWNADADQPVVTTVQLVAGRPRPLRAS